MKNVLFLVMALLFTASAAALQFDTPPDIQMTAVADINPVYIDPGLTDPSGSVVHGDQLAATFDPGDMCPAVQILAADNRSGRDYPSPSQAVKRKPIAYALYASLSVNLPDKVPR
jgi:hypothetical protein